MQNTITVCALATWSAWIVGLMLTVLVAVDVLPNDCGYLGIAVMSVGSVLFIRQTIKSMKRREDAAFALGRRLAVAEGQPALHTVI